MKYYSDEKVLEQPWTSVVGALWRRYPNPFSKHVLSEDTLSRAVSADRLTTRRLLTKTNRLPRWAERLTSARHVAVVEDSLVDLPARTVTTHTRNLGYTQLMSVQETVVYRDDPQRPAERTLVQRRAVVTSGLRGFSSMVERFGCERFRRNAHSALQGLLFVLAVPPPPPPPPKPKRADDERHSKPVRVVLHHGVGTHTQ